MDITPPELDWVVLRIGCDVKNAFAELYEEVKKDAEQYREKAPANVYGDGEWEFGVMTHSNGANISTVFERKPDIIEITIDPARSGAKVRVTPVLTENGHRKFRVAGEEEPIFGWQLRRRVLKTTLFDVELK